MSPENLWRMAIASRPSDPPFIVEARAILRDMPDGRDRRRGVNLVTGWDFAHLNAIYTFILPEPPTPRATAQSAAPDRCSYCGKQSDVMHSDHVVAQSRGGDDGQHNRVPACQSCNSRKSDKPFLVWLLEIGGNP